MKHENRRNTDQEAAESAGAHYAALTDYIVKYNGEDLLACHYGLWGPDTTTERESMLRCNSVLVQGCDLRPGRRVLDAGCGVGGMAIWLAETYGVHVTGLNICEPHIVVSEEHAKRRGVDRLVDFRHGDFMNMPFPDADFDLVINRESFGYAPDKLAYLRGVWRVLKPGGRWQALEVFLSDAPMSEAQREMAARVARNFHMPPLESRRDMIATLEAAGFEGVREQDFAPEVMPATEKARKQWMLFVFMAPPNFRRPYHDLQWGTVDLDAGLRQGVFTYSLMSGAKPARQPVRPATRSTSAGRRTR